MCQKTYKTLYLAMLEVGQEKVQDGVSYNEIKALLSKERYDFENDCVELAVKQWFYDSFHHRGADDNPLLDVRDLDRHLDCKFILKGESCLKLLSYQTSRNSVRVGVIAALISMMAVGLTIWGIVGKS